MALAGLLSGYGSSGEDEEEAREVGVREDGAAAEGPSAEGPAWPAGDFEPLPEAPMDEDEEEHRVGPGGDSPPEEEEEETLCACAPSALLRSCQLPAAPDGACEPALVAKLARFHSLLHAGRPGVTTQLRQRKDYRNPDFLQRAVDHFGVREYDSALVNFDPTALAAEDFADELAAETRKAAEDKQKRARDAVEFVAAASAADGAAARATAAAIAASLSAKLGGKH